MTTPMQVQPASIPLPPSPLVSPPLSKTSSEDGNAQKPGIQNAEQSTITTSPTLSHSESPGAVEDMPGSITRYTPLADISTLPTVLPENLASLITSIATSTRMTLGFTSFLIEAILETSQYSTKMSLGYLRRLLITAVSSARRIYTLSTAALEGDILSLIIGGDPLGISRTKAQMLLKETNTDTKAILPATSSSSIPSPTTTTDSSKEGETKTNDEIGFLTILDKYTNLGIYFIHHTFTMVELITMSGFFFTTNLIQSVHIAAIESVTLLDNLFGSNESSRTLSSIITLVKKEILSDDRILENKKKGIISNLGNLTKALTAFACLQVVTWKRTSKRLKMKVLYDCTLKAKPKIKPSPFAISTETPSAISQPALLAAAASENSPNITAGAGPGPSTMESRRLALEALTRIPQLEEVNIKLSQHVGDSGAADTPFSEQPTDSVQYPTLIDCSMETPDDPSSQSGVTMGRRPSTDETNEEHQQLTMKDNSVNPVPDYLHVPTVTHQTLPQESATGSSSQEDILMGSNAISTSSSSEKAKDEEDEDWIEIDDSEGEQEVMSEASSHIDFLELPEHNAGKIKESSQKTRKPVKRVLSNKSSINNGRMKRRNKKARAPEKGDEKGSPQTSSNNSLGLLLSPNTTQRQLSEPSFILATSSSSRTESERSTHISADTTVSEADGIPSTLITPSSTENSATPETVQSPCWPLSFRCEDSMPDLMNTPQPVEGITAPPASPDQSFKFDQPLPHVEMTTTQPSEQEQPSKGVQEAESTIPSASLEDQSEPTPETIPVATSLNISDEGDANPDNLFPHEGLIKNVHRFMRYSSAAYGQNFLRILGLGSSDVMFPSTAQHHANSYAFAQHTGIPIGSLLLSSFTETSATLMQQEAPPLVHYVAVEHSLNAIVLTCRGTLGVSDVLVDLTCDYQSIHVPEGDPEGNYYVHAGMWQSARKLTVKQSTVHETLVKALTDYPTYGLVLAGHSLGGGVASLLGILCSMPSKKFLSQNILLTKPQIHPKITTPFVTNFESGLPAGRPIHVYAYGPPAVTSIDLSNYSKGLISSIVQDSDIVPTLSLGAIKDFKNIALTLNEQEGNMAEEIVGRVLGYNKSKFDFQKVKSGNNDISSINDPEKQSHSQNKSPYRPIEESGPNDQEILSDWMVSLIKTMRADMDNEKLYPSGVVYIMEHTKVFITEEPQFVDGTVARTDITPKHVKADRIILKQCDSVEERFREPIFTRSMLKNHLPSQYEESTQLLYNGLGEGKL